MSVTDPIRPAKTARRGPANRLPAERRIAEIIAAARSVLAERGYENCVISEIAERAGVVEGTIYRYFENKRDLFIKVAESWFEEILERQEDPGGIASTRDRLRHAIRRALSIIRHEPALTRFVLMELRPDPSYRAMRLYRLNRTFVGGVMGVLKDAQAKGEIDPSLPLSLLRDMIFGAIEHQTWAFLRNEGSFSVEESADGITAVVFRGMRSQKTERDREGTGDVPARLERIEAAIARLETR